MATTNPPHASDDELDAILNELAGGQDTGSAQTQTEPQTSRAPNNADAGLGIDEEIIITKKRIPAPKLDDQRLRSDLGIPRLQRISKDRLRLKGKGHEVSRYHLFLLPRLQLLMRLQYGDIARMLNMYQLWLDDLYPRAKFADALSIIEKVGHTKRMQVDRKAWIDQGKPRRTREDDDDDNNGVNASATEQAPTQQDQGMGDLEAGHDSGRAYAALNEQASPEHALETTQAATDGDPDEDELDALLAESPQPQSVTTSALPLHTASRQDDPFADEMEAMADMEDMW
jgi:replication fork protection complex subunit Csm3/Swi3